MATTTNYGWTTPDDTALVKDGASAIRTLGSSVDTTTKNLNPETTLGDIAYRSSTANVKTRLGIGSTGNVLTVAGGVPTWAAPSGGAGNMVLIASGSLSGASVTISSLSTYTELYLQFQDATNSTANGYPYVRINGNTGATNYEDIGYRWNGSSMGRYQGATNAFYLSAESVDRTSSTNQFTIFLSNCKNTGFTRSATISAYTRGGSGVGTVNFRGVYSVAETVSSLVIGNDGGNWSAGTYKIWGA